MLEYNGGKAKAHHFLNYYLVLVFEKNLFPLFIASFKFISILFRYFLA